MGGLVTYGVSYRGPCLRAAGLADKLVKGAKPGDLPVEQPINFELLINLKSAKAPRVQHVWRLCDNPPTRHAAGAE